MYVLLCVRYILWPHRSFDVVLVAVVGLCAAQRDLVHAGYLALALLFFRKRQRLRVVAAAPPAAAGAATSGVAAQQGRGGGSWSGGYFSRGPPPLFKWLPAFNFVVMMLQLAYQVRRCRCSGGMA